jgi:hypothetical protein
MATKRRAKVVVKRIWTINVHKILAVLLMFFVTIQHR